MAGPQVDWRRNWGVRPPRLLLRHRPAAERLDVRVNRLHRGALSLRPALRHQPLPPQQAVEQRLPV